MNGSWPKGRRLLADSSVSVVVVEHRDRLGRMNTELAEAALAIVAIGEAGPGQIAFGLE